MNAPDNSLDDVRPFGVWADYRTYRDAHRERIGCCLNVRRFLRLQMTADGYAAVRLLESVNPWMVKAPCGCRGWD